MLILWNPNYRGYYSIYVTKYVTMIETIYFRLKYRALERINFITSLTSREMLNPIRETHYDHLKINIMTIRFELGRRVRFRYSRNGGKNITNRLARRWKNDDVNTVDGVKADDYRDDLPQCGYYRTAGEIFLSTRSREEVYPSLRARLTPHRYIQSLRPHCGPACDRLEWDREREKAGQRMKKGQKPFNVLLQFSHSGESSERTDDFYGASVRVTCVTGRAVTKTRWCVYRA